MRSATFSPTNAFISAWNPFRHLTAQTGPNQIETVTLIGDVKNRDVVLIDDIIDTAGTICSAAELLKDSGAHHILAACTHPILSGDAVSKLETSCFLKVFVTDSIPMEAEKKIDKIEILSSAGLFSEAIKRIHNEESISSLFEF